MAEAVLQQPQKFSFPNDSLPDSTPPTQNAASDATQTIPFALHVNSSPGADSAVTDRPSDSPVGDPQKTSEASLSTLSKGFHKRSRTSINKLPAFSFNPGASVDSHPLEDIPSSSSSPPSVPESPSRGGRHRRSTSELVGGNVGLGPSNSPQKVDFSAPIGSSRLQTSGNAPSQQGHRHQRSEAMSSQDIPSSVQYFTHTDVQTSGSSTQISEPKTPPSESTDQVLQKASYHSIPSTATVSSEPQAHVGFVPGVEIIPPPSSDASDGSGSSISTLKETDPSSAVAFASDPPLGSTFGPAIPIKPSSNDPNALEGRIYRDTYVDNVNDEPFEYAQRRPKYVSEECTTVVQLDENFDGDPTSTDVVGEESEQREFSTAKMPPGMHSSKWTTNEPDTGFIDLDLALINEVPSQDPRNVHVRSFQSARRSMHSSAVMSGFMGPGGHYHRRTESAPSLASISFERQYERSASEKGFGMENVFEEEEEDAAAAAAQGETQQREDPEIFSQEKSVDGLGIERDGKYSAPAYGAGVQSQQLSNDAFPNSSIKSFGSRPTRRRGKFEEDYELMLPQAPFMTPDTPSSSSFSSPKGQLSSDPSIVFQQSAEDVPSLLSSASTVGSAVPSNCVAGSSSSPAPGSSASTSDMRRTDEHRRKRASVVSLSRLMGGSYPGSRRLTAGDQDKRCQSSDGIPLTRTSKSHRLSRMFKFWKGKDSEAR